MARFAVACMSLILAAGIPCEAGEGPDGFPEPGNTWSLEDMSPSMYDSLAFGDVLLIRDRGEKKGRSLLFLCESWEWRKTPLKLSSLAGYGPSGEEIPPEYSEDINWNQSFAVETQVVRIADIRIFELSGNCHFEIGFSLLAGRQVFSQRIGSRSFLKASWDEAEASAVSTRWGWGLGGSMELGHSNPLVPAAVFGIFLLAVACKGNIPDFGEGWLDGLDFAGVGDLTFGGGVSPAFGFSLDIWALSAETGNRRILSRSLSGSFTLGEGSLSFFTGLYFGGWGVLKAGGEYSVGSLVAKLERGGPRPESWELCAEYEETNWSAFAELMVLPRGFPFLFVKAGTLGSGYLSMGFGLNL